MSQPNPLLMRCSLDELRRKLDAPAEPLSAWWPHFLTLARRDDWFGAYPVLAALITGEEADKKRARDSFCRLVELLPEALSSNEAQAHTHVTAAALGRWAIFYDWLAELELFSPAEDAAIGAALLDHAFVFPLQTVQSRIRTFDNQILSNAFGAAAIGYVFGVKRGHSALGRRLFSSGLGWMRELLRRLPHGGYSGEGSTYQEQIVLPLVTLASLFIEETTGENVMRHGIAPGPPALDVLRFTHQTIGPAGLLPAWDDYGFCAAAVKSPLALLARATGDGAPLRTIIDTEMWARNSLPGWETDDRLWTLVWWPQNVEIPHARESASWLEPRAAGALQNAENRLRLFQYWDVCGGLLQAGRLQTDPNAITLEAFGSPILVDGHGQLPPELAPLPDAARDYIGARRLETMKQYRGPDMSHEQALRWSLSGGIGLSNALFVDGEDWLVPERECVGTGEALHAIGPLQVVRSDATAFYSQRYDLESVTRTSVLVAGRAAFVCDRARSQTPHRLTWQAFVRQNATLEKDRVVVETPERVRCDLIPLQAGELELEMVEGYPVAPIYRSARVRQTGELSANPRFDFALVPQPLYEIAQDLTDDWRRDLDGKTVSLATAYLSDPATQIQQPRRLSRRFALDKGRQRYFVSVGIAAHDLQIRNNGRAATPTMAQQKGLWKESATFLPHFFEVTEFVRDGENEIEIIAPFFHGETLAGPVRLLRQIEPLPVAARRTGDDTFAVSLGETTDELIIERAANATWLHGTTDARYAVRTAEGTVAAAFATRLDLPDFARVRSLAPCDFALTPTTTTLRQTPIGTRLSIERPHCRLRVEFGGCLEISYNGETAHSLDATWLHAGPVVVNGQVQTVFERGRDGQIVVELVPARIARETPRTAAEIYDLAACDVAASDQLLEALQSENWRVQLAAADVAGRLELRAAVPILLQIFEEAEAELPYPPLTKWWRWSKMQMAAKPEGDGFDADLPELGVKRWRVKRAVVTALGLLGDASAAAPLEAALGRGDDFFPVASQIAVALGRLGAPSSIAVLERNIHHAEINTRVHAQLALQLLRGEIDRLSFESRVGLQ